MDLNYNLRDLFKAPRIALSVKKIWLYLKANLSGYFYYLLLNYFGLMINDYSFWEIWRQFGLYPCIISYETIWYIDIIFYISVIQWIYRIFFAATAVAKLTTKQLSGDEFFSSSEAMNFSLSNYRAVIFPSVSILLIFLFFIIFGFLFGLIGKIPFAGDILFYLSYIFILFGVIFSLFTLLVLTINLIYNPSIVGTIEENTLGAVFISYQMAWNNSLQILGYHIILIPVSIISVGIFRLILFSGFKIMNLFFSNDLLIGQTYNNIVSYSASLVWPLELFSSKFPISIELLINNWYNFFIPTSSGPLNSIDFISVTVLSFFLIVITLTFVSYFLTILTVGETIMFINFNKNSENHILADNK